MLYLYYDEFDEKIFRINFYMNTSDSEYRNMFTTLSPFVLICLIM